MHTTRPARSLTAPASMYGILPTMRGSSPARRAATPLSMPADCLSSRPASLSSGAADASILDDGRSSPTPGAARALRLVVDRSMHDGEGYRLTSQGPPDGSGCPIVEHGKAPRVVTPASADLRKRGNQHESSHAPVPETWAHVGHMNESFWPSMPRHVGHAADQHAHWALGSCGCNHECTSRPQRFSKNPSYHARLAC